MPEKLSMSGKFYTHIPPPPNPYKSYGKRTEEIPELNTYSNKTYTTDIVITKIKNICCDLLKKITYEDVSKNALLGYFVGLGLVSIPGIILKDKRMIRHVICGSLGGAVYFSSLRYIVYGKNKDIRTCCIFLNGVGLYFVTTKYILPKSDEVQTYIKKSANKMFKSYFDENIKKSNLDEYSKNSIRILKKNIINSVFEDNESRLR